MAVFPVTVDLVTSSSEAPGKYGPFLVGTNRYEILIGVQGPDEDDLYTPYLEAYKSTDLGNTWAAQDEAGQPIGGNQSENIALGCPYTVVQSSLNPADLFIVFVNGETNDISIYHFDCSTDTWDGSILSDSGISATPAVAAIQIPVFCAVFRPDNTILIAYSGDTYTDGSGETHGIVTLVVYDVGTNSWGMPFDAGYEDYDSVIGWHQLPCGMVLDPAGNAHLFMQQITHLVPITPQIGGPGDPAPWYALDAELNIECWGDGGGGAAAVNPSSAGGGGGAGDYASGTGACSGGNFPSASIGPGGSGGIYGVTPDGGDGEGTSCGGVTAAGGVGAPGDGSGDPGTGSADGGAGFVTTDVGGGGGGGGGGPTEFSDGTDGGDGTEFDGIDGDDNFGAGGNPGINGLGVGGAGGNYDPGDTFGDSTGGGPGEQPGGGGGGGAISEFPPGPPYVAGCGGAGGQGQVLITYLAVQGSVYNSRLWQQAVDSGDALGTLEEISDGEFPVQAFENIVNLMPFDCACASTGDVAICFSGCYNTTGYQNFEVMRGAANDPISFAAQVIPSGGTGLIDPSASVSYDSTGNLYVVYMQIGSGVQFTSRTDTGSGFGSPQVYGSFPDSGCRIQSANFLGPPAPEITFGVPAPAFEFWNTTS
jgi:hypothetical protein